MKNINYNKVHDLFFHLVSKVVLDLFIQGVSVQGVSVQGVYVQGVYVLGGVCPGGKCPGGCMPGGKCPGVHVLGGYVLEPQFKTEEIMLFRYRPKSLYNFEFGYMFKMLTKLTVF